MRPSVKGTPRLEPVRGWTGRRITALVAGSILALTCLVLLAGDGAATRATNTQRDTAGAGRFPGGCL
jgi:hypothetical protein